jgi:hypothetical protein
VPPGPHQEQRQHEIPAKGERRSHRHDAEGDRRRERGNGRHRRDDAETEDDVRTPHGVQERTCKRLDPEHRTTEKQNRADRSALGPCASEQRHDQLGRDEGQAHVAGQQEDDAHPGRAQVRPAQSLGVVLQSRECRKGDLTREIDEQPLAHVEDPIRDGIDSERGRAEDHADEEVVRIAAHEPEDVGSEDADAEWEQLPEMLGGGVHSGPPIRHGPQEHHRDGCGRDLLSHQRPGAESTDGHADPDDAADHDGRDGAHRE